MTNFSTGEENEEIARLDEPSLAQLLPLLTACELTSMNLCSFFSFLSPKNSYIHHEGGGIGKDGAALLARSLPAASLLERLVLAGTSSFVSC